MLPAKRGVHGFQGFLSEQLLYESRPKLAGDKCVQPCFSQVEGFCSNEASDSLSTSPQLM